MNLGKTKFETELGVRPDDIDMNQHVHASRYQDYVLAARYDQMARCYKMSMEEFFKAGLGWVRAGCASRIQAPAGDGRPDGGAHVGGGDFRERGEGPVRNPSPGG